MASHFSKNISIFIDIVYKNIIILAVNFVI